MTKIDNKQLEFVQPYELKNMIIDILERKCSSYCCDNDEEIQKISNIIVDELNKKFKFMK